MTFEERRRDLQAKGIDVSRPGFEDDPTFLATHTVADYAEFVLEQPYSTEYLERARAEVQAVSRFIFERVRDHGRIGACVDASELIHRMLERRGIWSFTQRGGVTIHYKDSDLPDGYYWPWSLNPDIVAGHCWIVAPPFAVVDTILYLEDYKNGEQAYLPEIVLKENLQAGTLEAEDIMMHDEFVQMTGEEMSLDAIARHDPTLLPKIERWGVKVADYPRCAIKYVPIDAAVSQYPLEEMEDNIECGTLPIDLMRQYETLPGENR